MEEIAKQFREELQEFVDRYKTQLSVPRIMSIAQDVFHKTLSIKYYPELHILSIMSSGPSFLEKHAIMHKRHVCPACHAIMWYCKEYGRVYWVCSKCGRKEESSGM